MFKKLVVVSVLSLGLVACSDSDSDSPCESANKVFNQFELQSCEEKFNSLENGDYASLILAEVEACYNTAKQIQGFAGLKCNTANEGEIEEVASAEEIAAAIALVESGLEALRASKVSPVSTAPNPSSSTRSNSNETKPVVNCETVKAVIEPKDLARITFNSSCEYGTVDPVTSYDMEISDGFIVAPLSCNSRFVTGESAGMFNVLIMGDTDNVQERFNDKYRHLGVTFSFHSNSNKGIRLSSTAEAGGYKVIHEILLPGMSLGDGYIFSGRALSASVRITDAGYCHITNQGKIDINSDAAKEKLKSYINLDTKIF